MQAPLAPPGQGTVVGSLRDSPRRAAPHTARYIEGVFKLACMIDKTKPRCLRRTSRLAVHDRIHNRDRLNLLQRSSIAFLVVHCRGTVAQSSCLSWYRRG